MDASDEGMRAMLDMITAHTILGICTAIWMLICLLLYRCFRGADWLAGSTVASCLFFLGATVLAGSQVTGALLFTPLWLSILMLLSLHLHAARSSATERISGLEAILPEGTMSPFITGTKNRDTPI